jgi:hypothetical protein
MSVVETTRNWMMLKINDRSTAQLNNQLVIAIFDSFCMVVKPQFDHSV